eukprot:761361-Hanusia_phi.AAC.4
MGGEKGKNDKGKQNLSRFKLAISPEESVEALRLDTNLKQAKRKQDVTQDQHSTLKEPKEATKSKPQVHTNLDSESGRGCYIPKGIPLQSVSNKVTIYLAQKFSRVYFHFIRIDRTWAFSLKIHSCRTWDKEGMCTYR